MEIITGRTNEPHIYSEDDGALYASIIGKNVYVLPIDQQLSAEFVDSNTIRINSGTFVMNGRVGRIRQGEYDTVTIDNGTAGYVRRDLIMARYTNTNGVESFEWVVVKGDPVISPGPALTPDWDSTGNILNGDTVVEYPFFRVELDGVTISAPVRVVDAMPNNLAKSVNLDNNNKFNPPSDIVLNNSQRLLGTTTGDPMGVGDIQLLGIQPCNENNNCVVGWGGYEAEIGQTNIYGNTAIMLKSKGDIDFRPGENGKICMNGRPFIMYKDYKVNYNQTAGDIGTRFLDYTVSVAQEGYQALGAWLWNHNNNYYAMVVPYISGTTLHVDGYRAHGSARSSQSLTVTVLYMAV